MTYLDLKAFNKLAKELANTSPLQFGERGLTFNDVVSSLPFEMVTDESVDYYTRLTYKLDTGSHFIQYVYTKDEDGDDTYEFYVNRARKPAFYVEKLERSSDRELLEFSKSFTDFVKPMLTAVHTKAMAKENTMPNNTDVLNKTSFSKKDITAVLTAMGISDSEIKYSLSKVNKTMIGKAEALPIIVNTAITYYQDEVGVEYSVDSLFVELQTRIGKGKTCTSTVLNNHLKEIWGAVAPTLHQYPKGHAMIKAIIIGLNKKFDGKLSVGVAQVREAILMLAIEEFSKFTTAEF